MDERRFAWNCPFAWLTIRKEEVSFARAQQVQATTSWQNNNDVKKIWNDNHVVIGSERAEHKVDYSICKKHRHHHHCHFQWQKNQFWILICEIHEIVMLNVKPLCFFFVRKYIMIYNQECLFTSMFGVPKKKHTQARQQLLDFPLLFKWKFAMSLKFIQCHGMPWYGSSNMTLFFLLLLCLIIKCDGNENVE